MRESIYTANVGRDLPADVYPLKLCLQHESGVADSWYSGNAADLWIEYKWYAKLPRVIDLLKGKKPKLTKLQQDWLTKRHNEGRNVGVIVATPQGAVVYPGTSWKAPLPRAQFLERALSRKQVAEFIAAFVRPAAIN